ncbi:Ribonucleoside-diphosphate reductase [Melia azedarach]|uniref:Ribonucleoside-diphosphate reductase n=1 Tax=Melia azedarach TaxID=155640 RepID=A0ACC1WS06_MELAZ|nr:Ribonucleoside-diphosphate reductase [Melia azedarach]
MHLWPQLQSQILVEYYILLGLWEIKQKTLSDMATDHGCYIQQSQSLNIHTEKPDPRKLTSLHSTLGLRIHNSAHGFKSFLARTNLASTLLLVNYFVCFTIFSYLYFQYAFFIRVLKQECNV